MKTAGVGGIAGRLASTPRSVPGRTLAAVAGLAVIVLAAPVFLAAGWPLRGWLIAAVLWVVAQLFGALLARLPLGTGNVAAAGARGVGTSFRAVLVALPLLVVTITDERVGVAALLLYAVAYTVELAVSLIEYFGGEPKA
jgi:hypothetical protein